MVIFKRKRMIESLKDGAPPGSVVVNNESGWMPKELFLEWLKHFVSQVGCTKNNPYLLILDGHVSHTKNIHAIEYTREHGVVILYLPPHTMHRIQPLDRVFFRSLMSYYNQEFDSWLRTDITKVSVFYVCRILGRAYIRSASMSITVNGFKCTGTWPCNRNVWTDADFAAAARFEPSDSETDDIVLSDPARNPSVQKDNSSNASSQSRSDQQPGEPNISSSEHQQANDPCPSPSEQQVDNLSLPGSDQDGQGLHPYTHMQPDVVTRISNEQPTDARRHIATNPDGRCFFRAIVIGQNLDMQRAERDSDGNVTTDLRMRMTAADILRSKMIEHMLEKVDLYGHLSETEVNADLPQKLC